MSLLSLTVADMPKSKKPKEARRKRDYQERRLDYMYELVWRVKKHWDIGDAERLFKMMESLAQSIIKRGLSQYTGESEETLYGITFTEFLLLVKNFKEIKAYSNSHDKRRYFICHINKLLWFKVHEALYDHARKGTPGQLPLRRNANKSARVKSTGVVFDINAERYSREASHDDALDKMALIEFASQVRERFGEIHCDIATLRLLGMKFQQIADIVGMSWGRVHEIFNEVVTYIKDHADET